MEPRIRVEQETARHGDGPDRWRVAWKIRNLGEATLKILAARAPHGKFRSEEKEFAPPIDLESSQSGRIELEVQCNESPKSVLENAFLIMRVLWMAKPWLILARLRVVVNEQRAPITTSELITAQPVGFASKKTNG